MPELPELVAWSRQADEELKGKTIAAVETPQPKCLNLPPGELAALLAGRTVGRVHPRGKWMVFDLKGPAGSGPSTDSHLLLSLGMGGEFFYHPAPGRPLPAGAVDREPPKYQFKLVFTDGSRLAVRFFWFGYVHAARAGELGRHAMTATLGPSPLDPDLDLGRFRAMVAARPRRSAKSFLMDQKVLAGIGNVYVQDSLWGAGLHPDRLLGSLSGAEVEAFWRSIRGHLEKAVAKGGLVYETDLFGRPGGFTDSDYSVAYKPGRPCPRCGATIEKIRTGATSTFICPNCQKL